MSAAGCLLVEKGRWCGVTGFLEEERENKDQRQRWAPSPLSATWVAGLSRSRIFISSPHQHEPAQMARRPNAPFLCFQPKIVKNSKNNIKHGSGPEEARSRPANLGWAVDKIQKFQDWPTRPAIHVLGPPRPMTRSSQRSWAAGIHVLRGEENNHTALDNQKKHPHLNYNYTTP